MVGLSSLLPSISYSINKGINLYSVSSLSSPRLDTDLSIRRLSSGQVRWHQPVIVLQDSMKIHESLKELSSWIRAPSLVFSLRAEFKLFILIFLKMRASVEMVIERSNQEQKKYSFYGDYPGRWTDQEWVNHGRLFKNDQSTIDQSRTSNLWWPISLKNSRFNLWWKITTRDSNFCLWWIIES